MFYRYWACNARSGYGTGMYQLSHGITDTKRPLQPLLNEFFFGVFLKHSATMSYGTSGTSGGKSPRGALSRLGGYLGPHPEGNHARERNAGPGAA